MESRAYLNAIFTEGSKAIPSLVHKRPVGGNMGLWEWAKGAKSYAELMNIIVDSPVYHLLYGIANPNLLPKHWDRLFSKFSVDFGRVYKKSLESLTTRFAFDEEIITPADRVKLNIHERKNWNLLHLAVVTLNVRAVDALISRGMTIDTPLALADRRTPIMLAKSILELLQQPRYLDSHHMLQAVEKATLRNEKRHKYPNFYTEPQDPTSATYLRNRAIINCKAIIKKLSDVENGIVHVPCKAIGSGDEEEAIEDFDL